MDSGDVFMRGHSEVSGVRLSGARTRGSWPL